METRCNNLNADLLNLIEKLICSMEDPETLEFMMLEKDFKNTSAFEIILKRGYHALLMSRTVDDVLNTIWYGHEHKKCNSTFHNFSSMILMTIKPPSNWKLQKSERNLKNEKQTYRFQYLYRKHSVDFIFIQEFLFSIFLLCSFQVVNFRYLTLFQNSNFEDLDDEAKSALADSNLDEYRSLNMLTFTITLILLIQLFLKLLFSFLTTKKSKHMIRDKWTIIDVFQIITSIISLSSTQILSTSTILTPSEKSSHDYYIIPGVIIAWIRFFLMLLMNNRTSPLLHTITRMVVKTLEFLFIGGSFIILAASVFMTLYLDINPDKFGDFSIAMRTLFDAMLGEYDYEGMGDRELSYSILLCVYIVIMAILLLNFLIAILNKIYDEVTQYGDFHYKKDVLMYCQKFIIPLQDDSYGQLASHPTLFTSINVLLLPILWWKDGMKTASVLFSIIIFWLENILLISLLLIVEILLIPIVYLKRIRFLVDELINSTRRRRKGAVLLLLIIHIPLGFFVCLYYVVFDAWKFIVLLTKNVKQNEIQKGSQIFPKDVSLQLRKDDKVPSLIKIQERMWSESKELQEKRMNISLLNEVLLAMKQTELKVKTKFIALQEVEGQVLTESKRKKKEIQSTKKVKKQLIMDQWENTRFDKFQKTMLRFSRDKEKKQSIINRLKLIKGNTDKLIAKEIISREELNIVIKFLDKFGSSKKYMNLYLALIVLPEKVDDDNYEKVMVYDLTFLHEILLAFQQQKNEDLFSYINQKNKVRFKKLTKYLTKLIKDDK
jgi:hypothetical protein